MRILNKIHAMVIHADTLSGGTCLGVSQKSRVLPVRSGQLGPRVGVPVPVRNCGRLLLPRNVYGPKRLPCFSAGSKV